MINGLVKYVGSDSWYTYKFIGYYKDDVKDGKGRLEKINTCSGAGVTANKQYNFEQGVYKDGRLYDGISYLSANAGPPTNGSRIEGALRNGYIRKSVVCHSASNKKEYKFGFRITCEGEVKDGQFCGYYRAYDEEGKLVFEGSYSDYLQTIQ
jgi:hypothetical protein